MTDTDRAILEAAELPRNQREAVAVRLGLSVARFHQRLTHILDDPTALETYPILVGRLRRIQAQSRRARSIRQIERAHTWNG